MSIFSFFIGLYPDVDSNRHSEAYQKSFLREYLETKRRLDRVDDDVTDDDVERLYQMTAKASLVSGQNGSSVASIKPSAICKKFVSISAVCRP